MLTALIKCANEALVSSHPIVVVLWQLESKTALRRPLSDGKN